jgi:hypothetical protein
VPAVDPDRPAPGQAPAPAPSPPAQAPGQQPGTTAEAPDIVDDPGECYRLITKGITHDHHIFPQTLRDEFARIGINIDDYTITIPASRHIGPRGVHIVLDWNDQWHVFFDEIPTGPFSPGEQATYRKKAIDMAIDLLHIGKMDGLVIHPYRKSAS